MYDLFLPALYVSAAASERIVQFARLWAEALGERRKLMRRDERLMACAQEHADYLAGREDMQVSLHVGASNSTPDARVRAAGYPLPDHWQTNHVESCSVNHGSAADAVERLLLSPSHRMHLLGENGFQSHKTWGIGNNGPFWVVLICP